MNISNNVASIGTQLYDFNRSADAVANMNNNNSNMKSDAMESRVDLSREIPTQIAAQNGVEANASSIKSADEMFGSLLDIKA